VFGPAIAGFFGGLRGELSDVFIYASGLEFEVGDRVEPRAATVGRHGEEREDEERATEPARIGVRHGASLGPGIGTGRSWDWAQYPEFDTDVPKKRRARSLLRETDSPETLLCSLGATDE
jgi:hypothetical protein